LPTPVTPTMLITYGLGLLGDEMVDVMLRNRSRDVVGVSMRVRALPIDSRIVLSMPGHGQYVGDSLASHVLLTCEVTSLHPEQVTLYALTKTYSCLSRDVLS